MINLSAGCATMDIEHVASEKSGTKIERIQRDPRQRTPKKFDLPWIPLLLYFQLHIKEVEVFAELIKFRGCRYSPSDVDEIVLLILLRKRPEKVKHKTRSV